MGVLVGRDRTGSGRRGSDGRALPGAGRNVPVVQIPDAPFEVTIEVLLVVVGGGDAIVARAGAGATLTREHLEPESLA